MLNSVILMGRLTRDPEIRTTATGATMMLFSVAVERDRKGAGEMRQTDFFDCVAWRKTAEFISSYFHKGQMICLQGRMETYKYDHDGETRKGFRLVVEQAHFCGNKSDGSQSDQTAATAPRQPDFDPPAAPRYPETAELDLSGPAYTPEEDLPF